MAGIFGLLLQTLKVKISNFLLKSSLEKEEP